MKFFSWNSSSDSRKKKKKKPPTKKVSENGGKSPERRGSRRPQRENRYYVQSMFRPPVQEHVYQPVEQVLQADEKYSPQSDFLNQFLPGQQNQYHFYYNPELKDIFGRFTHDSLTGFTRDPRKVARKISRRLRRKVSAIGYCFAYLEAILRFIFFSNSTQRSFSGSE
ncbi:hypothetical protein DMENIID0001_054800 [Sergentomyia squamirostris]